MIKKVNDWYVDPHNNRWYAARYTIEQAEAYSKTLLNCHDCIDCHDCNNCRKCADCYYCSFCDACRYCTSCVECSDCSYCHYCSYCSCCRMCSDYSKNPQRIIGWRMGRREDVPMVYWIEPGKELCIVGCFRGTLDQLEEKVKETHANNPEHLNNYLKFIRNVRAYQEACKDNE